LSSKPHSGTQRRFVIDKKSLPDLPGMMLATIQALKAMGGSASIDELDEKAIEIEGVTDAEQSFVMSADDSRLRVKYYFSWARTYLKRGDALANSARGVWSLTDTGSAISTIDGTRAIYEQVNKEERERSRQKRLAAKKIATPAADLMDQPPEEEGPDDEDWKAALLKVIGGMSSSGFERLAQRLLREAGFTKVEVRGQSGDGGIDGVGILRINLVTFQVYFQCKKWKGSIPPKEIRDFRGAMQGRADKGLFITTGHYSKQASEEATRDGATPIDLIDGDRLCDLLKENQLGVTTEMVEHVKLDPTWFQNI
jgi:restriction system protein